MAQVLSSLATLVVASGILYQGSQARKARDDQDRPQIVVDAASSFAGKPLEVALSDEDATER